MNWTLNLKLVKIEFQDAVKTDLWEGWELKVRCEPAALSDLLLRALPGAGMLPGSFRPLARMWSMRPSLLGWSDTATARSCSTAGYTVILAVWSQRIHSSNPAHPE